MVTEVESGDARFVRSFVVLLAATVAASLLVIGAVGVAAVSNDQRASAAGGVPTTVHVTLSEFAVTMDPTSVPPGDVTFHVVNAGSVEHNFRVVEAGVETRLLKPGESQDLVVESLAAGTVSVLCTVAGHEAAGMRAALQVTEGVAGSSDMGQAMAPMSWQEMDRMMEEVALKFPAETSGTGNGELEYTVSEDGFKVFELVAKIVDWEVEPGKIVQGWSYNGQIPAPIIRVNTGDKVRINLRNELPESTSLHLHGIRVPNPADGVDPYTQPPIQPGQSFTYEFTAREPSVGMYHSHHNAQVQVPNGLAGALLIDDWKTIAMRAAGTRVKDADGDAESEVVMVLNDSGTIGLSLNGKSFPATQPYSLKVGESMVVHYYNEGNMTHPMHLHQPAGLVVAHDGKVLEAPFWADTLNVAPGERWTVVYTALDAGVWAWHCHILTHAETPTGMRYMVTALIVE